MHHKAIKVQIRKQLKMMMGCAKKADCGIITQTEKLSNKIINALKTNPNSLFIFLPPPKPDKPEI